MTRHLLKLVNNERVSVRIASKKGYSGCVATAYDWCPSQSMDSAFCQGYAYDKCTVRDMAACIGDAHDRCTIDTTSCQSKQSDITT